MTVESAKAQTLSICEQLAAIETKIGETCGLVLKAGMNMEYGKAKEAYSGALMLDDMVTALAADIRRLGRELRH